jgi:hypothetical protein
MHSEASRIDLLAGMVDPDWTALHSVDLPSIGLRAGHETIF